MRLPGRQVDDARDADAERGGGAEAHLGDDPGDPPDHRLRALERLGRDDEAAGDLAVATSTAAAAILRPPEVNANVDGHIPCP